MYPVILSIGDFTITSFGLFMFLCFIAGAWVTGKQLQRYGMQKEIAWDVLAWVAIGGILGAKLYYLALNFDALLANPREQLLSRGGLVWYGGLIGGVTAYYWQIKARKLPMATMYDAAAPTLALSYAIGRMGCFLVGDDYGRYTDGPLGVTFPDGGTPPATAGYLRGNGDFVPAEIPDSALVPVHPTQLYEVGLALIMFAILWKLGTRRDFKQGQLFAVYLFMYGIERFMIEFVRTKSDRVLLGMSTSQIASIIMLGLAVWLWQRQKSKGAPTPLVATDAAGAGKRAPAHA